MEERKYANHSDEFLIVESQNTINEIRAFTGHHFVSERKIEQLSQRVNELVFELDLRSKKWLTAGESEEIKEMVSIISTMVENLKKSLESLKQKVIQTHPGN